MFGPIIYFFYPETSNLSLEEIDYLFVGGGHATEINREEAGQKEILKDDDLVHIETK